MKAIIWTKYGSPDVLQLQEVERPVPKEDEVLVKIYATTVNIGDCEMRGLRMPALFNLIWRMYFGFTKPKRVTVLGQELAGEIEAFGSHVTRFKKGDQVFAATMLRLGSYAQYECLPESYVVLKPANISFEEAATIPTGGIYGLHLLRLANVQSGEKILICGAGGSIGTYAVQIARIIGASVTAVDSTGKLDMLRKLGADHVIDYTREDFTKSGQKFDAIIDVIGKSPFSGSIKSLEQNGRYVLGNPGLSAMIRRRWTLMTTDKKVISESASHSAEEYAVLKELIEARKIKPVIDQRFPLEQIVEAHRYVETGQKKGLVVITVAHENSG